MLNFRENCEKKCFKKPLQRTGGKKISVPEGSRPFQIKTDRRKRGGQMGKRLGTKGSGRGGGGGKEVAQQ